MHRSHRFLRRHESVLANCSSRRRQGPRHDDMILLKVCIFGDKPGNMTTLNTTNLAYSLTRGMSVSLHPEPSSSSRWRVRNPILYPRGCPRRMNNDFRHFHLRPAQRDDLLRLHDPCHLCRRLSLGNASPSSCDTSGTICLDPRLLVEDKHVECADSFRVSDAPVIQGVLLVDY
ncbi:hypothetical protein OH76DRAFT_1233722 [Lentinus brumalis]|uniref:Uncharacterized protein n=1 Tax=Lentinus brumalis TaxID=2498619 RepID=A0A371CSF9_9APHY|nr:hypothetical protein OH76DRAFT_1233722 [Polyporus brumalis]